MDDMDDVGDVGDMGLFEVGTEYSSNLPCWLALHKLKLLEHQN